MWTNLPFRSAGVGLLLLIASGCASGSPEYVGTPLQGSVSELDVRVDTSPPGVLVFPDASVDELRRIRG